MVRTIGIMHPNQKLKKRVSRMTRCEKLAVEQKMNRASHSAMVSLAVLRATSTHELELLSTTGG